VIAYPGCEPGNHDNRKAKDVETGELEQVEIGSREATTDLLCFLFVGKGYRMKGLDVLLSACRILKKRDFRFKLHVVGMSAKPIDILRLRFLGLLDCVEYRGYVDDMPREFALCKAIVTPSRLDSFGMAPLEAMQYGLVPVVGRNSGIAETIESEKNGLVLQDHLDAKELANLMGKLLSDRELLKVLSNGARAKAAEFTWEKTADATLDAYRLALASGAGRSTKKA
ncbi:MAG: glycosyltransferase family 4 protein, partial [Candidatus Obscuribacterales bacterium]|nr:glycosyltransferase family 4 protein [Candidatus Obscuribacterales bacterium]